MRKHNHSLVSRRAIAGGILVLLFVVACDKGAVVHGDSTSPTVVAQAIYDKVAPTAPAAAREATAHVAENVRFDKGSGDAMLIRHGVASLEVAKLDDALGRVRQSAAQFGGFVANTAIKNGKEERPSATLEVRVPSAQFDGLLGALNSLGKVESVSASVQDVGEEYVDMGARATNAKRMEARLVEMLATRTGKLEEVLTVEQELRRVREEIERYDARLRYLERHASVSSLEITIHEPLALIDRPRPGPIVVAVGVAWERTLGLIAWCIASLGVVLPLGVLLGVVVWTYRWLQVPRFREE